MDVVSIILSPEELSALTRYTRAAGNHSTDQQTVDYLVPHKPTRVKATK